VIGLTGPLINSAEKGRSEEGKEERMLRSACYVLQGITVVALVCASIIRATMPLPAAPGPKVAPAPPAGFRTAAIGRIDDAWSRDWGMPIQKEESIHQTFSVAPVAGARAIQVMNIFGSIEVTGGDGDGVQMDVDKTFHAESSEALEQARKDVALAIEQNPGLLKLEVEYRPRCALPDCWGLEGPRYAVETNFRLKVPRDSDLTLRTVEGRGVRVDDVRGTFSISNVNGGVTMENVAGSGTARTINGPIKVRFRENPRRDSQFASMNGGVDLYFAKDLSADFRFRTSSGSVYSDFPILAVPMKPVEERRGAAVYFRTNSLAGGQVGTGGPLIRVESLNGEVRILEKHD
jgi:hypothetical protein